MKAERVNEFAEAGAGCARRFLQTVTGDYFNHPPQPSLWAKCKALKSLAVTGAELHIRWRWNLPAKETGQGPSTRVKSM
ncbi:hypothetical protein [Halioxenophilus aromaticivorans]|uniref:hypothetical protein n=1 Tax=Halioxenophilus aromaticivorans TaxID=1306992 RepID=UPI0031EEE9E1